VTNISKEMTSFSDFPPPEDFPMYMSARQLQQYMQLYAAHHGLLQNIRFNTEVRESRRRRRITVFV